MVATGATYVDTWSKVGLERLGPDPRYAGRIREDSETAARWAWERCHPGGSWQRVGTAVRYGWERVKHRAVS